MKLNLNSHFLSFVIPAFNEEGNLAALYHEISDVAKKNNYQYEIVLINDGSRDRTQNEIDKLFKLDPQHIRGLQMRHNYGKATALQSGFQFAKGDIIVQMDADLQDDPHELPKLLAQIDKGFDLVVGWKQNRKDSFIKNNTSKLYNAATNFISKTKLHDYNCGFKVYKSEVAKGIDLYGELHRYIPVIAASQGYQVTEVPVEHRLRHSGKTKYGPVRFIHGAFDLLTVLFITRFRARPLHLFGLIGLIAFGLGVLGGVYLSIIKIVYHQSIGTRPSLLLSVMLMIMGVQIGVTGLVGEQIISMLFRGTPPDSFKKVLTNDQH